jgi:HAD superfamily hydrolase (TIGR01548 family)
MNRLAGPALDDVADVRAVIFDVDGVLLDARPSYHAVAEQVARRAVTAAVGERSAREAVFDRAAEIPRFKAAGGFNDDWEMACAIALVLLLRARLGPDAPDLSQLLAETQGLGLSGLLRARGKQALAGLSPAAAEAMSPRSITRACCALYGGRAHCRELFGFEAAEALPDAPEEGLWMREEPLAEVALLQRVAARFPAALYTGRNPGEARLALERTGLVVPERLRWLADGRPRKPDPAGLIWLCGELLAKGGFALFLGDTADDARAAAAAQDAGAPLIYAHIRPPPAQGDTVRVLTQLLSAGCGGRAMGAVKETR